MSPLSWRERVVALAACCFVATLFLGPALLPGHTLSAADLLFQYTPWQALAPARWPGPANALLSDTVWVFEPWLRWAAAELHAGRLPLWNPNNLLGAPFFGNMQSGLLAPFNWPFLAWPVPGMLVAGPWAKLVVAGFGTYLLARESAGCSRAGSALAAVTFGLGAFVTMWLLYSLTSAGVWLPWLWWATAWLIAVPSRRSFAGLTLLAALSIAGGHPETSFHLAVATGLFAIFWTWQRRGKGESQVRAAAAPLALWVLAYALGAALMAVQILPFLEYLNNSAALHTRSALAGQAPVPAPYLWTLISPDLFGSPAHRDWWPADTNYLEANTYSGFLPVVLAPLALLLPARRRLAGFLLALAAVCALLVYQSPILTGIGRLVPLMGLVANQRLLLIIQLVLGLLAAFGADALLATPRRAPAICLALVAGALLAAGIGLPFFAGETVFHVPVMATEIWQTGLLRAGVLLAVTTGLAALALAVRRVHPEVARWLVAALPLVLWADLWQAHGDWNPALSAASSFPLTPAAQYLASRPAPFRIAGTRNTFPPNTNLPYGFADIRGYDAVEPVLFHELAALLEPAIRLKPGGSPTIVRRLDSPLLDLLSVRYVVTAPGEDPNLPGAAVPHFVPVRELGDPGAALYLNPRALPRAWVTFHAEIVPDATQRLARLADSAFDPRATALLTSDPGVPLPSGPAPAVAGTVTITRYLPGTVDITVRSPAAALLILADQAFPGWRANVNGRPAPILTADHALRAVILPPGTSTVTFRYQPDSITAGAGISLTAAGVLVLALLPRRRRRFRPRSGS